MAEKLTTKAAIEQVLATAERPLRVAEMIEAALPLTRPSAKTPTQTVYAVLYAEAKKPGGVFERVGKGECRLSRRPGETSASTVPGEPAGSGPPATKTAG